jgi:hypothetical protein
MYAPLKWWARFNLALKTSNSHEDLHPTHVQTRKDISYNATLEKFH